MRCGKRRAYLYCLPRSRAGLLCLIKNGTGWSAGGTSWTLRACPIGLVRCIEESYVLSVSVGDRACEKAASAIVMLQQKGFVI